MGLADLSACGLGGVSEIDFRVRLNGFILFKGSTFTGSTFTGSAFFGEGRFTGAGLAIVPRRTGGGLFGILIPFIGVPNGPFSESPLGTPLR